MFNCPYDCGIYRDYPELLICRPMGFLDAEKVNDIAVCRDCIQRNGLTQVNRFHNLSNITSVSLNFDDIRSIVIEEVMMRKNAAPIKACYLVPNPVLYGTIRMYQSLIESAGVEAFVSYEIDELAEILNVNKKILTG